MQTIITITNRKIQILVILIILKLIPFNFSIAKLKKPLLIEPTHCKLPSSLKPWNSTWTLKPSITIAKPITTNKKIDQRENGVPTIHPTWELPELRFAVEEERELSLLNWRVFFFGRNYGVWSFKRKKKLLNHLTRLPGQVVGQKGFCPPLMGYTHMLFGLVTRVNPKKRLKGWK